VRRLFVTDHNFPRQVTAIHLPEAELRSLTSVDPWLTQRVADWAVLLGLHQYKAQKIHGFITNDDSMLNLSRTLPVLMQTELTLLVCAGVGDDPVAATGLLLLHLPYVARRWGPHPEAVVVRPAAPKTDDLPRLLEVNARRAGATASEFRRAHELDRRQLTTPLRDWYEPGTS